MAFDVSFSFHFIPRFRLNLHFDCYILNFTFQFVRLNSEWQQKYTNSLAVIIAKDVVHSLHYYKWQRNIITNFETDEKCFGQNAISSEARRNRRRSKHFVDNNSNSSALIRLHRRINHFHDFDFSVFQFCLFFFPFVNGIWSAMRNSNAPKIDNNQHVNASKFHYFSLALHTTYV